MDPQYADSRHTTPQPTKLGLHPVIYVPNYMDHYSFTNLRDGWLSWPCWLTDSGRLNHGVVTHPASSLAQDRESSPAETNVLTAMLRRQLRHEVYMQYNTCKEEEEEEDLFCHQQTSNILK